MVLSFAATDDAPWLGVGVFTVAQHLRAVHEDVLHPSGILLWAIERGMVLNFRGIEHHYIGEIARLERASLAKLEVRSGQRSQTANGFLKGDDLLVAHVFPKQPREVAIDARMAARFEEHD